MTTKRLTKIDPLSCGKVLAAMYFGLSLLFIPFFLLMMAVAPHLPRNGVNSPAMPLAGFGVAFIVIIPVFYTVIGFVGGIIAAFIYNAIARLVGGFEFTFEDAPGATALPSANALPPYQ